VRDEKVELGRARMPAEPSR
jgi:hypothetical protein